MILGSNNTSVYFSLNVIFLALYQLKDKKLIDQNRKRQQRHTPEEQISV